MLACAPMKPNSSATDAPQTNPIQSSAREANFDGLVGPTHSYAGLSYGNVASMSHRFLPANPREAALQGLRKARRLAELGFVQGLLAPQERPNLFALKQLGFTGASEADILAKAYKLAPEILAACSSASSMWTANAATVCPSSDAKDGRVHFTPANLNDKLHRALETQTTAKILRSVFPDERFFCHHEALPQTASLGDEGAANHTRLCAQYGAPGLQIFVYGRSSLDSGAALPSTFPARQTREASEAVARLHQISAKQLMFVQQNPKVIDAGAFHNDVVAVGNQAIVFHHELAFLDSKRQIHEMSERFIELCQAELQVLTVSQDEVSLADAIKSYLFNSQLLTLASGRSLLIAPQECENTPSVRSYLTQLSERKESPIERIEFMDLRQSMRNGGGPACLRLRVVLSDDELEAVNNFCLVKEQSVAVLEAWVNRHYRDRLVLEDLCDPQLLVESRQALDELTQIMHLGSIYPFQLEKTCGIH